MAGRFAIGSAYKYYLCRFLIAFDLPRWGFPEERYMHFLAKGTLILLAGALCSCNVPGGDTGKHPKAAVASEMSGAVTPEIQQVLLEGEGGTPTDQKRPEQINPDTPISVTVTVLHPDHDAPGVSLRLIDLKNGQVLEQKTLPVPKGQESVHFEFKPAQPWSEGRHLLEARLGAKGKVFQREFDVMRTPIAAAK